MCGIFGYSGKQPVDLLRLRYLATENQSRGDHSTGIYGNHLFKKAMSAKEFVLEDRFTEATEGAMTVIGHTRHATMGAKTDANSHPFEIFRSKKHTDAAVVGTHNGMVFEYILNKLVEKYGFEKPDVDSQLIYQMLVELNFDYDEALSQIEAAMALAFVRPDLPDYLYLYHRTSRPIHIGYIGNNMWYSSEATPLWLIGCDTVSALDTDQMFVFKKGTLVEVSDVKKSCITTIKEDQTLTGWTTSTASHHEKSVVGLNGVSVRGRQSVTTTTQDELPFRTNQMTVRGGQNTRGTEDNWDSGGDSTNTFHRHNTFGRSADLTLLPKIPGYLYHFETLLEPQLGKFYHSGNDTCTYIIFQLVAAHDMTIKLPAWYVKVKQRPVVNCLSIHNGLGVLEIPNNLCGTQLKLEIHNPIQPGIVYEMPLTVAMSGRVMEVALYIPFQETEEKVKALSSGEAGREDNNADSIRPEKLYNQDSRLSAWLAYVAGSEFSSTEIHGESLTVQGGSGHGMGSSPLQGETDVDDSSTRGIMRLLGPCKIVSNNYHKKTDILGMDRYTTGTNVDELEAQLRKARAALSSVDDAASKSQEVLVGLEPFLDYLCSYFTNRYDVMTDEEDNEANVTCS